MSESITEAWEASNLMTCLGINIEFRFYRFLSDQVMRGERIKNECIFDWLPFLRNACFICLSQFHIT